MRCHWSAIGACVCLAIAGDARAEEKLFIEGSTGIGTPTGWLGTELVVLPVRLLALHGGAGLGSQGLQVTAGTRLRIPISRRDRVGLGASWSSGSFAAAPSSSFPIPETGLKRPLTFYWERAHFLNVDLSLESYVNHWLIRTFVGVGYALNGDDAVATNGPCREAIQSCTKGVARFVPYFGFAAAFGVL